MSALVAYFPALARAKSSIEGIAANLREEHSALTTQMGAFLDGDWTGGAAGAFEAAFAEWSRGRTVPRKSPLAHIPLR